MSIDKQYSDKIERYEKFDDFLRIEIYEIMEKSGLFDEKYYLEKHPEVEKYGWNPYAHYVHVGIYENYEPNKTFDSKWYSEYYGDIKKSNINPFLHYILWGKKEGRFQNKKELNKKEE